MSTPNPGAGAPENKPKGLARFKRRLSKILGKEDVAKANQAAASSSAAATKPPTSTSATVQSEPVTSAQAAESKHIPAAEQKTGKAAGSKEASVEKSVRASLKPKSAKTAAENTYIQEEKVRALFAKYGLELDVGDWKPTIKTDIKRIEKPIRVRVHRTCHRCQTQYGVGNICSNCSHKKCRRCTRYPRPKTEKKGEDSKESTGKKAASAGYVKRPATQRTRKLCHECQTPFRSKESQCSSCEHKRCSQCVRETHKVATGGTGGAGSTPSLSRTIWTCHECKNVHRDPENSCLRCSHEKCSDCPKDTLKKPAPPPDDTAVPLTSEGAGEGVEERMKRLGISPQASAA